MRMRATPIVPLFLLSILAFASDTTTLSFVGAKGTTIYEVPIATRTLGMYFTHFTSIKGLEKLPQLEAIKIHFADEYTDYLFLRNLPIRQLVIDGGCVDGLRFLAEIPLLEFVFIWGCNISMDSGVDLSKHSRIRFVDVEQCHLKSFPFVGTLPATLEYLWLIRNDIDAIDAPMAEQLKRVKNVSFLLNPIATNIRKFGLPKAFANDRPYNAALPNDLRTFLADLDSVDSSITGKDAP